MTSPMRVLRQIVAPNGRHRARPMLLPDEPIPAPEPAPHEDQANTPESAGARDE